MTKRHAHSVFLMELMKLAMASAVLAIAFMGMGCGGGGDDAPPPAAPTTATLSGIASKAPIKGATVSVYEIDDHGQKVEPALGETTTGENGEFTIEVDYIGPVLVEVTQGQYMDEATGGTMKWRNMPLRVSIAEAVGEVTAVVTPLTELAVRKAELGGFTSEKIGESTELMSQLVGCDISTTLPADPYDLGASGSDSQRYALFLGALSQMAANKDTNIAEVIDAVEEDLDDLLLNDTGFELMQAFTDFVSNKGITDDHGLGEVMGEIIAGGLTPPGDLGMAEDFLADFLADPTQEKFNAFTERVTSEAPNSEKGSLFLAFADLMFAPNSEDGKLFMALADLIDIYNEVGSDFSTLVLKIENILKINYVTYFQKMLSEEKSDKYLRMSIYDTGESGPFDEMKARLDRVSDLLDEAQGINAVIFLPGFDTFYFDDIDVTVLRSIVYALQSACVYVQSLDLMADNWVAGMTDDQKNEFIKNNEDLLTYSDPDKLDSFIQAFISAQGHFNSAVTMLNDRGESRRVLRQKNAFNIDTPYELLVLRAVRDETLPSIVRAFDNWYEYIITVDEEELNKKVIVADDGFAYYQTDYALYLNPFAPVSEQSTTLYHLVNGIKSPRHVWDDYYQAKKANEDTNPYCEIEQERIVYPPYPVSIPDTEWDDPIDTYTIELVTIIIDGKESDWGALPILYSDDQIKIKLARDNREREDNCYLYVSRPAGFEIPDGGAFECSVFMEMPFSGDSYQAEVKWDGQESLEAKEYRRPPGEDEEVFDVPEENTRLIKRFGTVIGLEVKFTHLSTLVKAGGINRFCCGSICDMGANELPRIKLLPEADN